MSRALNLPTLYWLICFIIILKIKFSGFTIDVSVYWNYWALTIYTLINTLHWFDGLLWLRTAQMLYFKYSLLRCVWLKWIDIVFIYGIEKIIHRTIFIMRWKWILIFKSWRFRYIWIWKINNVTIIIIILNFFLLHLNVFNFRI